MDVEVVVDVEVEVEVDVGGVGGGRGRGGGRGGGGWWRWRCGWVVLVEVRRRGKVRFGVTFATHQHFTAHSNCRLNSKGKLIQ